MKIVFSCSPIRLYQGKIKNPTDDGLYHTSVWSDFQTVSKCLVNHFNRFLQDFYISENKTKLKKLYFTLDFTLLSYNLLKSNSNNKSVD